MKKILFLLCLLPGLANADTCQTSLGVAFPASQKNALCNKLGSSVVISQVPQADNTIDLGSASKQFRTAYIGTSVVFASGANAKMTAYVPTMVATPVIGTNSFRPGLNVIPTAAASTAAFLGANATPVAGEQYRINNASGATVRIKAAGGATLNGETAGGYISIVSLATVDCFYATAANAVCLQPVIPTPAGP